MTVILLVILYKNMKSIGSILNKLGHVSIVYRNNSGILKVDGVITVFERNKNKCFQNILFS
jgi:hypothetical protein